MYKKYLQSYLESKRYAWSPSTFQSEEPRLKKLLEYVNDNPETLWNSIETLGAYTRQTSWTRVCDFYDFLINKGLISISNNPYRQWRRENARSFKNVYTRKQQQLSFRECSERIRKINNGCVVAACNAILRNGLRISELSSYTDGQVRGKGNKLRAIPGPEWFVEVDIHTSRHLIYRELKKVGLKPHDLRKVFATHLVKHGANIFQLCKIMGWSNVQTAQSYVNAGSTEELNNFVKEAIGE